MGTIDSKTIDYNIIAGNIGGEGAALTLSSSEYQPLRVSHNTITGNTSSGSVIYLSSSAKYGGIAGDEFKNNTVTQNKDGAAGSATLKVAGSGMPTISGNNLFNNATTYEVYNTKATGSPPVNVENNWWGTSTEMDIQARIYDYTDDASRGIVDYSPFLTSPDNDAPPSPPSNLIAVPGTTSIVLSWNANPESDISGYNVYYDTNPDPPYEGVGATQGNSPISVGNLTSFTLSGLTPVTASYYVAVTAYDQVGSESWYTSVTLLPTAPTPGPTPVPTANPTPTTAPTPTPQAVPGATGLGLGVVVGILLAMNVWFIWRSRRSTPESGQ